MLILAIDTTSEYGGAGLFLDSRCLACAAPAQYRAAAQRIEGSPNYSVILFQMIDSIMARASLNVRDVELFAVATGPGSFTGIRVGVAAVQAWAQAFARPVAGVSVLTAMAEEARAATAWTVPVMDARRGEFFVAAIPQARTNPDAESAAVRAPFGQAEGAEAFLPGRLEEGLVMSPGDIRGLILRLTGTGAVACVYREYDVRAEGFIAGLRDQSAPGAQAFGASRPAQALPPIQEQRIRGTLVHAIERLASRAREQGRLQTPADLDAFYVRRSDAEMRWTE
jgi:tRNA threonylcarbamoyl adenosine modification protein YeaZ